MHDYARPSAGECSLKLGFEGSQAWFVGFPAASHPATVWFNRPVFLCDINHCSPAPLAEGHLAGLRLWEARLRRVQISAIWRRLPPLLLVAGLKAVAPAPTCEQQIGMMGP
jgi:hypothetical protein